VTALVAQLSIRLRWWLVAAAWVVAVSLVLMSSTGVAAAKAPAVPSAAGIWSVYEPNGGVGATPTTDTYTITRTAPSTYTIRNAEGFDAPGVAIGAGGSATGRWTCDGCTGWGLETFTFKLPRCGAATFTGDYQAYNPDGSKQYGVVKSKGTRTSPVNHCTKKQKVVLSGVVLHHRCLPDSKPCQLQGAPVEGRGVQVVGPKKTYEAETDAKGVWSLKVPKGRYTVRIPGARGAVKPDSRDVDARGDVSGLDFSVCKAPSEDQNAKFPCKLVEINGVAIAGIDGKPYAHVNVFVSPQTRDDQPDAVTDASGEFVLYVDPGSVRVALEGEFVGAGIDLDRQTVDATHDQNSVTLIAPPKFFLRSDGNDEILAVVYGLPVDPLSYTAVFKRYPAVNTGTCTDLATQTIHSNSDYRDYQVRLDPPEGEKFCGGNYLLSVAADGNVVVSKAITLPYPGP
jgi:hypothetical protein